MKKITTTIIVLAAFILAPFYPVAEAAVTGTLSATITVPNVSATTITFPSLSGGANASASTTISIPALSGGVNGTAAVGATATLNWNVGTGTTTSISVSGTQLFAGSTTVAFDTDATTTASDIAAAINANTGVSGYSAVASGTSVTLTAPTSLGASINGTTPIVVSDYFAGGTAFSGGVTGVPGVSASSTSSSFVGTTANAGADLSLNIGGTSITLTGGQTGAQVAAQVAAQINAASSSPYTALVVNTDQVQLTAKTSGTAGNAAVVATDLVYNLASAQAATSTSGHFAAVVTGTSTDRILNIGGTAITLTSGDTAAQAAAEVAAQINAASSSPYTATTTNTDEVMLTSKTTGTAGNGAVVATDLSYNATPEVAVFIPGGTVTVDETYRATINGTHYDVTTNASSTIGSIVAALAPMIDADTAVSCTQNGTSITCTASTAGTAFTASGTVLSAGPTLLPVTISSNNSASTSCAKAGDVVTLSFTTSHPIATSTSSVTINGTTRTITSLGGNQYSATFETNASTTPGTVTFSISGMDTNGNSSTTASTTNASNVTFINTAPTVTLNGDATMRLANGATYNELGATSTDALGRPVTVVVSGNINTSLAGPQTVTYTATDCAGNTSSITRTINVDVAPAGSGGSSHSGSSSSNGLGPIASIIAQTLAPITTGPAVPATIQEVLGVSTIRFTFNLKEGVSSEIVFELQQKLKDLGYYTGPVTGYFGKLTKAGVMKYQKAHKISATGLVGPQTRAALNAE